MVVKQNELAQSAMSVGTWVKRLNRMNSELQEGMRGALNEREVFMLFGFEVLFWSVHCESLSRFL